MKDRKKEKAREKAYSDRVHIWIKASPDDVC